MDEIGVDVLELGVPFSDPLADGLVNQLAAQRGLDSGTTPGKLLETVSRIRKSSAIPIVLYIYFNLLHKRGLAEFVQVAADAGVDKQRQQQQNQRIEGRDFDIDAEQKHGPQNGAAPEWRQPGAIHAPRGGLPKMQPFTGSLIGVC